jgi:hypothetical protein
MGPVTVLSQDPAYLNFSQNRFLFNPSLTGIQGAQSYKLRSKLAWNNDGGQGYKTLSMVYEETVPCSILDIGFKLNYNEEGAGLYRTSELGFLSAAFIPVSRSQFSDHNLRIGLDFSWGLNSIDFSRLVWSDQLDAKYGAIFPSSFIPPNEGRSNVYMNPGLGFSFRSLWNKKSKKAVMTNTGVALYRFYSTDAGEINQSVSVLGLRSPNPYRLTAFAELEFVPLYYGGRFLTLRPTVVYQKQGNIHYVEAGMRAGYLRDAGIGCYFHTVPGSQVGQTRWFTLTTDFMISTGNGKKIEFSLSWSENVGGLQNLVGPQFELGISYHLASSNICKLMGLEDDVPYNQTYTCPIMSLTPGKRKMYENIWYKN